VLYWINSREYYKDIGVINLEYTLKSMVVVIVALLALVLIMMVGFLLQGAPFVRTSDSRTELIIKSVRQIKPRHIVDLGCGDGKLAINLAKAGYKVDGVEIQPWLVWRARRNIKKQGLEKKVNVYWANFWKFDVSGYDLVILFSMQHIMPRLERKLVAELAPKSHIISNTFIFTKLKPGRSSGKIHTYKV
jgi:SAM-dependent methyltransferase